MKYALVAAALIALAFVACGGGDDDSTPAPTVPPALEEICIEGASAAGEDVIQVAAPQAGDQISSPLRVSGNIDALDGRFWIAVVLADGSHVIDYPGDGGETEGTLAPFSEEVPFTVTEPTDACLWVYRQDTPEPDDAVRVPIVLIPEATATPGATQ